ncbi:MAG: triose-phosphate isomerase [Chlorobi bacterium]|nr:triose-phosphate isomerase [Chlorobiota bacterium]
MRKKIVAGNWKMHLTLPEAESLARAVAEGWTGHPTVEVLVAPSFPYLEPVRRIVEPSPVGLAAQNAHWEDWGAYTGEVSVPMLRSVGVDHVILGHSERRKYFGENDDILKRKTARALAHGMHVIYCVGEDEAQRERGEHFRVVENQVAAVLGDIADSEWQRVIIAYEPVWAIGTGKTATPEQAAEMHARIREIVARLAGDDIARAVPVLYGGSVKPANAAAIFAQPGVDGGLIGGASLKADDFLAIVRAAVETAEKSR